MKLKSTYQCLVISLALITCSCSSNSNGGKEKISEENKLSTISLSVEQQTAIGLELGEISLRNLKTTLKANGKLMLPPQNQSNVNLPVGGIVKSILVIEGSEVKQGQILATIQSTEFIQLQQDYLKSKAELAFLKTEFERQQVLQKDNINATKTFEKAQADYDIEIANCNALKQKLTLYNVSAEKLTAENISNTFPVVAPISGYIHTININIGTFMEPNKQLFDITDNRFLHIDLTIFEKDITKIHPGQTVFFTDANHVDKIHKAEIFSVNKAFENGQQAVIAHANILNVNETLLPGMFIEARVTINDNATQSVPETAIVSNGNDHYIFVQDKPNQYRQVQVRVGTSDLGFSEIFPYEVITSNQKIVIKGAYNLLSEITKGSSEHEE